MFNDCYVRPIELLMCGVGRGNSVVRVGLGDGLEFGNRQITTEAKFITKS